MGPYRGPYMVGWIWWSYLNTGGSKVGPSTLSTRDIIAGQWRADELDPQTFRRSP